MERRNKAHLRFNEELKEQQDFTLRRIQDALSVFGWPERVYYRYIRRKKSSKKAESVETILKGRDGLLNGL